MADLIHLIEFGVVQAGPSVNPQLECVTGYDDDRCEFNEFVAEEGHTDVLYELGWPASHAGSDLPIGFPLFVREVRDRNHPDVPTWDFVITGVARG